ncbi:MAG: undecaprenyl/decaprenyl-phosphate alpha-N-acetylglucosaminyl 1-phosphate transferase [Coriobacteriia bacterium]|nr:undecaprenyl/decaprenyl-phosphate alpha-N-acetylglucosaminyl 1-phosphate transferase [Coriobacteriia bacterium]
MWQYIVMVAVGFSVTVILTPLIREFSRKRGLVAKPGARKIHDHPVPDMGGSAILLGIISAIAVQLIGEKYFGWAGFHSDVTVTPLMIGGVLLGTLIVYLTGLIDDIYDISAYAKLAGQIFAGLIVALSGVQITYISNPFHPSLIQFGIIAIPVTIFYFVAFANIINLIDGMDGLATGISAIAGASLAVIAIHQYQIAAALLAAAVVGACLGFLRYNFPPASIFMGDQGALALGFMLGAISLLGVLKTTFTLSFAIPLLVLAIPIFDTFSAIVRRIRGNRPIGEADDAHMHHQLIGRGFSPEQTLLMVYAWSILLAISGYFIQDTTPIVRLLVLIVLFILTGVLTYRLGLFGVTHHHPPHHDE